MYGHLLFYKWYKIVAGPCEFLVMYGSTPGNVYNQTVAGPCEFLVMYG